MLQIASNPIFNVPLDREQRELSARTVLRRPSAKRQMLEKLHSRNALKEIGELPGIEESLHIVCRGNFPLWGTCRRF